MKKTAEATIFYPNLLPVPRIEPDAFYHFCQQETLTKLEKKHLIAYIFGISTRGYRVDVKKSVNWFNPRNYTLAIFCTPNIAQKYSHGKAEFLLLDIYPISVHVTISTVDFRGGERV
jgi:hypothetical protein